jgi:hypothetical protein
MTATESTAKPIDEPWMVRALVFVIRYRRDHDEGPTWDELWRHMRWQRKFGSWYRMQKLSRRGLVWEDGVSRSLDVSDAGKAGLSDWHRRTKEAA